MTEKTAPTIRIDIFIAGDLDQAKHVCREYCLEVGLCVTVEPVAYIYTGGEEAGVRVGLMNYPRFPTTFDALMEKAGRLADRLMIRLYQQSYSILTPTETVWVSRRPEEAPPPPQTSLMGPDFGSHGSATAMFDVIAERLRQQEKEGWTPEHDDAHKDGELAQAAAVYAHPFEIKLAKRRGEYDRGTNPWPWYDQVDVSGGRGEFPVWGWEPAWLKKTDRRRDLVKAAALIIAEIERLDRVALATTECLPE